MAERLLSHEYNMETIAETIPSAINDLFSKLQIENFFIAGIGIVGGYNVASLQEELKKEFDTLICIDNGANSAVIRRIYSSRGLCCSHRRNIKLKDKEVKLWIQ